MRDQGQPRNTAEVTENLKGGAERTLKSEFTDPYPELYSAGEPHAFVAMDVSKGFDFGNVRVTSRVSLVCNQNSATLDRAGVLAFEKAYAFAMDGFEILMAETQGDKTS
jgi:hypothetical protein